jgi:two-component system phosphate regulon sensor histidine kinase PhoR
MRLGFRGKIFFAIFAISAASLALVAVFVSYAIGGQTTARIERSLTAEARLVADVLSRQGEIPPSALDAEADRLAATLSARVTFIGPDGTVLGDSMVPGDRLATLANHGTRPEVIEAGRTGAGTARRHSDTLNTEMMYAAVRVGHPPVSIVRLAIPLTEVQQQTAIIRQGASYVLVFALVGAVIAAGIASLLLGRRLNHLAQAAGRYAAGDLSTPVRDYGTDELGTVARALDGVVRELASRASELGTDRARTDAILAGMAEGVVVVNGLGKVQVLNRAARQMLSVGDAATGHYVELIRHPGVAALLTEAVAGGHPAPLELSPRQQDRRLVARAAPVAEGGNEGAVLVMHDITDLRRADQVRRDFVANVSHELRTPLTAIKGYAEALADPSPEGPGPEERARFLDVIVRHANGMERLVRDLLRLASLDARQETVELDEAVVEEVLDGAVADLRPIIETRRQRVEIRASPAEAIVRTDAGKLRAALRNLVENAVNYSPEGRLIEVDASLADGRMVLRVIDEGPGIPEADLERVFERFYRVDKARSRESGGTGLGLSIVKHLIELLGGRVWAANRPEGGAVFTIVLPLA